MPIIIKSLRKILTTPLLIKLQLVNQLSKYFMLAEE